MTRFPRTYLWILLAAALFARAVLPQGYMPERSASRALTVTICGSHGVWHVPLGDGEAPDKKSQRAGAPCAFAGMASPAVPPPSALELPVPAPVAVAHAGVSEPPRPAAPPRLRPPARGPPLPA